MATPLFEIQDLGKSFGAGPVLAIDQLSIPSGQVTVLQGPNGAGKTTLLSILALLLRPDQGRVLYRGHLVSANGDRARWRRQITLVDQDPYLFTTSVAGNVAYGLARRGLPASQRRERVQKALETVGLAGFESRRARRLSGGEKQRVALARALVLEPRALLLDEPFANLDPSAAQVFERVIADLPASGCAVVMVSHAREHAHRLASLVITLEGGRVVAMSEKT